MQKKILPALGFLIIACVLFISCANNKERGGDMSLFLPEDSTDIFEITQIISETSAQPETEETVTAEEKNDETEETLEVKRLVEFETTEESTESTESIVVITPPQNVFSVISVIHEDFTPSADLINSMNEVIENDTFRTGFCLKSLDGSIKMGYNINQEYSYDSTIKTAAALYIYKEVVAGRVDLDTYINDETIGGLLNRMLITSDSDAYLILKNYFGKDKINALTASLGCKKFRINNDWGTETPTDAVILWEGVYKFCNDSDSGETGKLFMYQLLNSYWNFVGEILPQYTVAHKYGQTDYVFGQNCFIFKDEGSSYIFTYYSSGGREPNNLSQVVTILDEIMKEYDIYLDSISIES